jgi:hypothetical protein
MPRHGMCVVTQAGIFHEDDFECAKKILLAMGEFFQIQVLKTVSFS